MLREACIHCGSVMGYEELRIHAPKCPQNPDSPGPEDEFQQQFDVELVEPELVNNQQRRESEYTCPNCDADMCDVGEFHIDIWPAGPGYAADAEYKCRSCRESFYGQGGQAEKDWCAWMRENAPERCWENGENVLGHPIPDYIVDDVTPGVFEGEVPDSWIIWPDSASKGEVEEALALAQKQLTFGDLEQAAFRNAKEYFSTRGRGYISSQTRANYDDDIVEDRARERAPDYLKRHGSLVGVNRSSVWRRACDRIEVDVNGDALSAASSAHREYARELWGDWAGISTVILNGGGD